MFPKYIYCLLYNFNLWGFCIELPELKMSQKWTHIMFGVQIMCSCFITVTVWLYLIKNLREEKDLLNMANTSAKLCAAMVAYWFIVIESYWKRPMQQKFWLIYRQIRNNFNRSDRHAMFRSYGILFVHFVVSLPGLEAIDILLWSSEHSGMNLYFLFAYTGLAMMHVVRIFHYLFFIRLLDHQLDEVGREMQSLTDASVKETLSLVRLRRIRIYYDLVHELSNCINEIFGWSNIINVLYMFLILVVDLNWIYWKIHNGIRVEIERTSHPFIQLL